jgi:hypothetical protein
VEDGELDDASVEALEEDGDAARPACLASPRSSSTAHSATVGARTTNTFFWITGDKLQQNQASLGAHCGQGHGVSLPSGRRFGTCGRRSSCFFAARACRIVWISCSSSPRRGAWRKSAISEAEPDRGDFKGVVVLFPEEWYPELDSRCMKVQKLLGKVQRSTLMLNSVNAKNHVRGVAVCERGGH